ncbi:hypothetical protein ED312_04355 [Sinomicrobium pectinilyticum]|uniref:Uncharacterized protein n=1 Tax=Sinomicrobium pectinilyticum TaxID=1084421 RepID=A0A3N0EUG9_SINP1|nr:hypothetical protein [Sinomicrobium pectinilyticum]RNL91412.1 hypothetical protein ED312_04355 [Sinomicrobium pectinilyticum]
MKNLELIIKIMCLNVWFKQDRCGLYERNYTPNGVIIPVVIMPKEIIPDVEVHPLKVAGDILKASDIY